MKVTDESTIVMNASAMVPAAQANKKRVWTEAVVAGVPAIVLGSLGTVYAASVSANEVEQSIDESDPLPVEENVTDQAVVEHVSDVTDEMSFSEVFAAARAELGPGAVFSWNGNLYSTYYAEEWEAMTEEQKQEFADSVSVDEAQSIPEDDEISAGENEIVVLGQETVEAENGQLVTVTCVEENGHYGEYYDFNNDGRQDAALFDTNDDGRPDLQIIDENGDGYIDDNEVYVLNEQDMIAEACYTPEDALYDDMPDYINDADTSSFA